MLTLIEEGADTLEAQISLWEKNRKMAAIQYTARKEGLKLGPYPVPALQVSEQQAKQAIEMHLLLLSLQQSPYKNEKWTMGDTNAELVLQTEPVRTFKKGGYSVYVYFDNDVNNGNEYPAWKYIYALNPNDQWEKHKSYVTHDGIYYRDSEGTEVYYTWFGPEADKYSKTGQWTVQTEPATVSSVVTSSNRTGGQAEDPSTSGHGGQSKSTGVTGGRARRALSYADTETTHQESPDRFRSRSPRRTSTPAKTPKRRRFRSGARRSPESTRGRQQPSSTTSTRADTHKRQAEGGPRLRGGGGGGEAGSWPSPAEVGTRHRQVPTTGLSRLAKLQQAAWDPPVLLVKGPANQLKCWRRRSTLKNVNNKLFTVMSTVWKWVAEDSLQSRLLIAFDDKQQRERFLHLIHLPKGCTFAYGSLASL